MKVAMVTTGRFHVLDLARELDRLGHDVMFYSYVSKKRCEKFGLPGKCHRSLLKYVFSAASATLLPHAHKKSA